MAVFFRVISLLAKNLLQFSESGQLFFHKLAVFWMSKYTYDLHFNFVGPKNCSSRYHTF